MNGRLSIRAGSISRVRSLTSTPNSDAGWKSERNSSIELVGSTINTMASKEQDQRPKVFLLPSLNKTRQLLSQRQYWKAILHSLAVFAQSLRARRPGVSRLVCTFIVHRQPHLLSMQARKIDSDWHFYKIAITYPAECASANLPPSRPRSLIDPSTAAVDDGWMIKKIMILITSPWRTIVAKTRTQLNRRLADSKKLPWPPFGAQWYAGCTTLIIGNSLKAGIRMKSLFCLITWNPCGGKEDV